jgi:hypothetical protein
MNLHTVQITTNNGDPSAFVLTSLLIGYHLTTNSWLQVVQSQSQCCVMTNGQLDSLSWCQTPSGTQDQIFVTVRQLWVC